MEPDMLRRRAEEFVEHSLAIIREHGSNPNISDEVRRDLVESAMKVAGYQSNAHSNTADAAAQSMKA